jgi:hypothetical protein
MVIIEKIGTAVPKHSRSEYCVKYAVDWECTLDHVGCEHRVVAT